jgi:preprotein translocase subunit SecG
MEFTKAEIKILSPKHEKIQKVMLWAGILFIGLSIVLIPYIIYRTDKIESDWEETHTYVKKEIDPKTRQQIALKSMLVDNIETTKKLSLAYLTEKSTRMVTVFLFLGCFLIGSYLRSRTYTKLIRKLQNS